MSAVDKIAQAIATVRADREAEAEAARVAIEDAAARRAAIFADLLGAANIHPTTDN